MLDTALVLVARDAVARVRADLGTQAATLAALAEAHRSTPCVARTLTQHAVPTTFGTRVAAWLTGVLDAHDDLAALPWPLQLGGAGGTLAAVVELAGPDAAAGCRAHLAAALDLEPRPPWHTARRPVTRLGDALVAATDAWGRIARDVLEGSRPEVGELAEGRGGGSSTMPHKRNPVLSVLLRRAALVAPPLAATLHAAAADQVDERADGAWHAEWQPLVDLLRGAVVAAGQATDLLRGLEVRAGAMRERHDAAHEALRAEQERTAALTGAEPRPAYDGLVDPLLDEVLARPRPGGTAP